MKKIVYQDFTFEFDLGIGLTAGDNFVFEFPLLTNLNPVNPMNPPIPAGNKIFELKDDGKIAATIDGV